MIAKTTSLRWLIGSALLAASTAQASEPGTVAAEPAPLENGVRAYIDPATGKLRAPTPAERAEEARQQAAARKANAGKGREPTITRRKDGSVMATDNDGRFMESTVATRNADGSLSYSYQPGNDQTLPVATPAATLEEK